MMALTKKQKVVLLHIRSNPKISFRQLAKRIGRGLGTVQKHVLALMKKGYLVSDRKVEGAFVLVV